MEKLSNEEYGKRVEKLMEECDRSFNELMSQLPGYKHRKEAERSDDSFRIESENLITQSLKGSQDYLFLFVN